MKIPRQRVSVVVLHHDRILGFHAEDPHSHRAYFLLPGGQVEENESELEAAVRETREETGYEIEVLPDVSVSRRYDFEWDGRTHASQTTYYAGLLISEDAKPVEDADYHRGVAWLPAEEIDTTFAYHPDILQPVQTLAGHILTQKKGITYFCNRMLSPSQVVRLYDSSGIHRPTTDLERIATMFANSNLIISAWQGAQLVGVARSLSDFSYCCYLADLAVKREQQDLSIDQTLIELTENAIGPKSNRVLISDPDATDYCPKLGFVPVIEGYIKPRSR